MKQFHFGNGFIYGLTVGGFIGFVSIILSNPQPPEAIEVYQGKTTLQVTYEEGIPVDSVVVYKNK